MKTKLTLFVTVLAVALFGMGCGTLGTNQNGKVIPLEPSPVSSEETQISFTNKSNTIVVIRWVTASDTGEAELVDYGKLAPGEGYIQKTFVGHNWVLFTENGKEIGRVTAAAHALICEITGDAIRRERLTLSVKK